MVERTRARSLNISQAIASLPFRVNPPLIPFTVAVLNCVSHLPPPPFLPSPPLWWPAQATMYPISDLTTFCRKTLGDVPPKLVVCIPPLHHSPRTLSLFSSGRIYHRRWFQGLPICAANSSSCYTTPYLIRLVQGGRLVAERRMVTDIYMFDIETFTWEKISQASDSDHPRARYFHSTDVCESLNIRYHM